MNYFPTLLANDLAVPVEVTTALADNLFTTNNVWMMLCTALVFIMHLGFATVETGFGQAKNTVNILFKNTITPVIGILTYAIVGFYLMYPGFESPGWFSFNVAGWNLFWFSPSSADVSAGYAAGGYTYWTDFLFQAMFAATAATIVTGDPLDPATDLSGASASGPSANAPWHRPPADKPRREPRPHVASPEELERHRAFIAGIAEAIWTR